MRRHNLNFPLTIFSVSDNEDLQECLQIFQVKQAQRNPTSALPDRSVPWGLIKAEKLPEGGQTCGILAWNEWELRSYAKSSCERW